MILPRMRLYHLAWAAGLLGLPLSHYWLLKQVEPFYSSIYCFLWWSYILAADFAVYGLRRTSLLHDRPREFLFLCLWSIPLWMIFELVNLRIQNWYYVMVPWSLSGGAVFLVFAFGTVLPGLFETTELVLGVLQKLLPNGRITSRPFSIGLRNVRLQWGLGWLMLALLFAFPQTCFCLAWGFAFFLAEPICYWTRRKDQSHVGRSLLGQLAAGDCTRLVALLVAGFICGGLWEAWNITARTKWIYSVPFFDELKLGEMPVLGFVGFPPFALECYALVNLLSLLRGGRNWELTAAENRERPGTPTWGVVTSLVVVPLVTLGCGLTALWYTVASCSVPLDYYFGRELGAAGVSALHQRGALEGHQFLKLREPPPEIPLRLYERIRRLATLSECKGMGIGNALALEAINITGPGELALEDPADLACNLWKQGRPVRLEEVRIWIREARQRTLRPTPASSKTLRNPP